MRRKRGKSLLSKSSTLIKQIVSRLTEKKPKVVEKIHCSYCKREISDDETAYVRLYDLAVLCSNCVKVRRLRVVKRGKKKK